MPTSIEPLIDAMLFRAKEAFIRGAIWAFIGLLHAMLFVSILVFARHWGLPFDPFYLAGVLAGTIGAVIYSSMRLGVFMATLLFPIETIYLAGFKESVTLHELLWIMTPLGALIGAIYGLSSKASRIRRADAKTLAGLVAGLLATTLYLLLTHLIGDLNLTWTVALLCPLTGVLYVILVPTFIQRYEDLLPPVGDGAVVGAAIAVFISLSSFVMIGSVESSKVGTFAQQVQEILSLIPSATLGGILGAGLVGILSGLVLTDWQDL